MKLRHIKRNKKGGLQISINAIVILILAITVLGIGLGFIRGMFSKTIGQLGDVSDDIKNDMINRIRNSDERLALREENIEMKKSGEKTIYFGIRNEEESLTEFDITFECTDSMEPIPSNDDYEDYVSFDVFSSTSRELERDEIMVLPAIVKASPKAIATTYMCTATIEKAGTSSTITDYASKTFYVTVTS